MAKYIFKEIKNDEFMKFVESSDQKSFLQTTYMKEYYKLKGRKTFLVGVYDGKKIVAAALISEGPNYRGYSRYDIYRGFVMDYNDEELLKFFTEETAKFLRDKKCYMFTINPNLVEVERDTDANIIENAKNSYDVIDRIKKLGYIKSPSDTQAKWTYALDINGMTSDELFKTFKQNTRNIISRTINKYKLDVRTLSYDELDELKKITAETSDRRGFEDKPLSYYQNLFKAFGDKLTVKVSELNCDKYLDSLILERKEYEDKIDKINRDCSKKDNYIKELGFINKKIDEIKILKEEKGNIIPLSCAMFILCGDEIVYFSSGSYKEYMQYYGQYIIQWEMIKYACDNNYKRYNFYGIFDVFNKKGKDYGVYEFKKGFSGYVRELMGEYTYILNKRVYFEHKFLSKLRNILKH